MAKQLNKYGGKIMPSLVFTASLIYFGFFRFWMIPSGDDYFWWGKEGTYLLHHGFYGPPAIYGGSDNGRYLGNLLEIGTMHSMTLAVIAYAFGWTLLMWCIWRLTNKSLTALLLSFLFVFTLQAGLINNVLAWNAGFVNYVPPMILALLYIIFVEKYRERQVNVFLASLWTLFLSVTVGLFNENMAIGAIIMATLVLLYSNKKAKLYHVVYFVGTIISTAIMFSNPGYRVHSTYRGVTFKITNIWRNYSNITHFWLITFNIIVLTAILLSVVILTLRTNLPVLQKIVTASIALLFLVYYYAMNDHLTKFKTDYNYSYQFGSLGNRLYNMEGIVSILLVIFMGYVIFTFYRHDPKMWLFYLMTGAIEGQLLFVYAPLNIRGYFLTYVFMYLIGTRFTVDALATLNFRFSKTIVNLVLLFALIFMGNNFLTKIHANYLVNIERVSHPSFYEKGLEIKKHVPYPTFVWADDLTNQQNPAYWRLYLEKHNLINK